MNAPLVEKSGRLVFSLPWWTGHLLLALVLAAILLCSHGTFRYIEDKYRRRSRGIADRFFSAGETERLSRQSAAQPVV